jgi:hypothetical protein
MAFDHRLFDIGHLAENHPRYPHGLRPRRPTSAAAWSCGLCGKGLSGRLR